MTTPMTKEALAELREVISHATQGKWFVDNDFDVCSETSEFIAETHGSNLVLNAKFIAVFNPDTVTALLDELKTKDKRIAEQSMLLEGSDAILADYAEALGCSGDSDSILGAIVALQSRAESAEQALLLERQKVTELESRTITVTLPEPACVADFVLPVAVYTQETIIDCLASRRITLQIHGGE